MPEKKTKKKAASLKRQGKKATTQAGPYVEEEMRHKKSKKHGKMGQKQAIAIGLSKARQSGVKVPKKKKASKKKTSKKKTSKKKRSSR
jgi:hypothetical protein